tara:strand:+ start:137 stop:3340 length:3204 start_codon:yes stop_codon:yes gene_type:complete
VSLRKPSELFESKVVEEKNSSPARKYLNDSYQEFEGNLFKIEELGEKIETIYTEYPKTLEVLSEKLKNRVTKTDLDKAMFTHLSVVDENFQDIKSQIKGLNKNDLKEFKNGVSVLTSIVENLVDVELPKYKNKVTGNEIKLSDKLAESEKKVAKDLIESEIKISDKLAESEKKVAKELSQLSFFIEEKVDKFGETKEDLLKIAETYKKLYTVISNKYTEENEKIKEYSKVLEDFNTRVNDFTNDVENKISDYEDYITNQKDFLLNDVNKFKEEIKSDVADIKSDVIVYEKHVEKGIDRIENYIQDNKKDLVDLKENVIKDITNILNGDVRNNIIRLEKKINDIREKYDAIKPEEIMQDIQEGLVTIPPDAKNSDPLTPLDQNYVTTKQLQDHYRLFLNRIQQQLSTLGGGGETRLQYLDDIVGIATNIDEYDGKFLSYDSAIGKFEFKTVSGSGSIAGIDTTGTSFFNQLNVTGTSTFNDEVIVGSGFSGTSIKIKTTGLQIKNRNDNKFAFTTVPGSHTKLFFDNTNRLETTSSGVDILGALNVTGNVSIAGTLTYEDVTNIDSVGLITARSGIEVSTGTATTALVVNGDAVVTGNLDIDGTTNVDGLTSSEDITISKTLGNPVFTVETTLNSSRDSLIKIRGARTAAAGNDIAMLQFDNKTNNAYTMAQISARDPVGNHNQGKGKLIFRTATSGTLSDQMVIDEDGNVGIGTDDPKTLLDVRGSINGFDTLVAPYGNTVEYTVVAASKSNHRYQNQGSANAYYINGIESPVLTLTPGRTYRFNNTNTGSHPLKFYYQAEGVATTLYTSGVNFQNTYTEITVSEGTPNVLYYGCTNHGYMGNAIITNSKGLQNVGVLTATSFSGSGENLTGLTGASAATYGNSTNTPVVTVDANGRITNISTASISGGGGGGTTINNNADNRVITGSNSANTLEAESSLTFDGTTLTATSFSGGGNNIVTARWTLGANGSSHYTFTGPGGLSSTDDPKIYLARGQTYEFVNNSGGAHPFQIQETDGTEYSTGVTNNGAASGTIKFEVPFSAPNTLRYRCTNHGGMGNDIIIYPDLA